jgi:hypothetical protein
MGLETPDLARIHEQALIALASQSYSTATPYDMTERGRETGL